MTITFATTNLAIFLPKITLLIMGCLILAIDAYLQCNLTYHLSQGTLIGTALLISHWLSSPTHLGLE